MLRFCYALLRSFLSRRLVALLCVVASELLRALQHLAGRARRPTDVLTMLRQFLFLLLSQSIINLVALEQAGATPLRQLEFVAQTTVLLIFVHALAQSITNTALIERSLTLLLYMYTDALEVVLDSLRLGSIALAVCAVLYVLLLYTDAAHAGLVFGSSILCRGLGMVCINIILNNISAAAWTLHTKAGLVLLLLFASEFLIRLAPFLAETKGYVIWKTAQIVHADFLHVFRDINVSSALALLLCLAKELLPPLHWTGVLATAMQLFTLVVVNMVLAPMDAFMARLFSWENIVVGFVVVILLNSTINTVKLYTASHSKLAV